MTGTSYKYKFVYADSPGENVWDKVRKSSKIGQEQKTLITASA